MKITYDKILNKLREGTDLSGKADLVGGKVPSSQLPSYVDDVIEVANYAALPVSGEIGKIYITLDNNKTYRWSGSIYVEVSSFSDEMVKYDAGDATAGYIADKIVAGTGISVAEGTGGNENKLEITNSNPTPYTLPVATASVLGGVKKGDRISIDANGVISADIQGGAGDISGSGTANELAYFTAEKTIDNLPVATYPSLTELTYVKGVTSAIQTQINSKVAANGAITGATKTKITYDAKGLVTAGADATTADIVDSSNKRYVTDAQLTVIGNTSGTNTGDQDLSGLVTKSTFDANTILKADTDNTPAALTVAEQTIVGRITGGQIDDLSASQVRTLLNVADGATANAKAIGSEVDTGTDDTKYVTSKAIKDSKLSYTDGAETLTNKRRQFRNYSTTSTATLTPEIDTYDTFTLTAQAAALNIANHSTSTPVDKEMIKIDILSDATPRAITYGTNYISGGATMLTTTTASKWSHMIFEWSSARSKYVCMYAVTEA